MALARHGEAIATARAFQERSGAQRVVLLLDRGDGEATMIDSDATHDTEVTESDGSSVIPAAQVVPVPAKPLPDIRPTPASAITIDVEYRRVARTNRDGRAPRRQCPRARARIRRSDRATAEFATSDPDLPITLAAREGEPVVLGAGDAQYEL